MHTKVRNIKDQVLIDFGNAVRKYRKQLKISQEQLGFKSSLHRTYIGMIERGEKNITLTNIYKIARALEIDPKNLFESNEN